MCGRYTLTIDIKTVAEKFGVPASLDTSPRYNIAPTQEVVSVMRNGASHLEWLRWGLIPSWAKDESIGSRMINARAETLAQTPNSKELLRPTPSLTTPAAFSQSTQH